MCTYACCYITYIIHEYEHTCILHTFIRQYIQTYIHTTYMHIHTYIHIYTYILHTFYVYTYVSTYYMHTYVSTKCSHPNQRVHAGHVSTHTNKPTRKQVHSRSQRTKVINTTLNTQTSGACLGVLAGLAAITPAAGYIRPWASVVIGLCASLTCGGAVHLMK
jgi:hypothetical protein